MWESFREEVKLNAEKAETVNSVHRSILGHDRKAFEPQRGTSPVGYGVVERHSEANVLHYDCDSLLRYIRWSSCMSSG